MDEKPPLGSSAALWRALLTLGFLVALPSVLARWLNEWTVFAFPLGTFMLALVVPVALIAVVTVWYRSPSDSGDIT